MNNAVRLSRVYIYSVYIYGNSRAMIKYCSKDVR